MGSKSAIRLSIPVGAGRLYGSHGGDGSGRGGWERPGRWERRRRRTAAGRDLHTRLLLGGKVDGQSAEQRGVRDLTLDTYRYLRGGMVVMVVLLAAGIIGSAIDSGCWQGSISAYYYTTAHSVFIASLCAIGVQMIVYRGSSDTEDALLNLAGILAFIVAFVPTEISEHICGVPGPWVKSEPAITNNVWAIVIALMFARVASWLLYRRTITSRSRSVGGEVTVWALRVVMALGIAGFVFFRELFDEYAHNAAAIIMFLSIIATVSITAFLADRQQATPEAPHPNRYRRLYQAIAALMFATLALVVGVRIALNGWDHWVLVLEALLIAEFAAYWVLQTIELWKTPNRIELIPEELRSPLAQKRESPGPAGLMNDVRQLRRCPPDERMLRAL